LIDSKPRMCSQDKRFQWQYRLLYAKLNTQKWAHLADSIYLHI
jgi:hypothetical protein